MPCNKLTPFCLVHKMMCVPCRWRNYSPSTKWCKI